MQWRRQQYSTHLLLELLVDRQIGGPLPDAPLAPASSALPFCSGSFLPPNLDSQNPLKSWKDKGRKWNQHTARDRTPFHESKH
jgi:hypothetical protein